MNHSKLALAFDKERNFQLIEAQLEAIKMTAKSLEGQWQRLDMLLKKRNEISEAQEKVEK